MCDCECDSITNGAIIITPSSGTVYGNTLSNINASNLAFGVINSALIYANTLSNIQASNITQPFANLVVSNSVTTTNVFALSLYEWSADTGISIIIVDQHATWRSVTWSPSLGLFVAVGIGGTLNSAWSPDGQNWYAPSIPISSVDGADWNSVTWSPSLNLFVAVGFGGSLNSALFKKIGGDVFASNSVQTSNLFVSDAYASNSVQTTNFFATSTLISTPGSSVTTITNFEGPPRYFNSVAMDASGSNVIVTEFSTANIYTFSSITQTWSTSVIDILYINPTWVTVSGNGQVAAIDFHEASVVCLINDPFGVQTFLFSSVLTSGQPYSIALDYTGQTLVMSGGQISVLERGEFVIFPLGGADIITISGDGSTISAIYGSTLVDF